jgi:C4-type Zn-finger protein
MAQQEKQTVYNERSVQCPKCGGTNCWVNGKKNLPHQTIRYLICKNKKCGHKFKSVKEIH